MKTLLALPLLTLPLLCDVAAATPLRSQAGTYELQVMTDGGQAPTYYHSGENYVMGQRGQRYTLRIHNHSGRRIEAVVSVDGRDVVDGKTADYRSKRGYLVQPWGYVDVDGWRVSQGEAAAFRFSSVANSYVGRTGSTREVGVIGVAVFPERYMPPPPPPRPLYVPRHELYNRGADEYSSEQRAPAAKSAPSADAAPPAASAPLGGMDDRAGAGGSALAERDSLRRDKRPGLGTGFGERVSSPVEEVVFYRHNPVTPALVLGVRYNDRSGLIAMGVDVDGDGDNYHDSYLRRSAEPFVTPRRYADPPAGWPY
jgi:hypothetical protein